MHMADALLSPVVAGTMYVASGVTTGVSIKDIRKENDEKKLPVMAVSAALVFAGQMINYTIPGTGSSGHLCGGFLLASLLGPQAGFLSMVVILALQALFFADGGIMALGANCWNMAFYGCFVGYNFIFKPIMNSNWFSKYKEEKQTKLKLIVASLLGCTFTLQLGAFSVVLETYLSGISELTFGSFLLLMQPIHLAIGLIEGIITACVLVFVYSARPEMVKNVNTKNVNNKMSAKKVVTILLIVAIITGGIFSLFASSNPDGLEWSLFGNAENGYSSNMGLDEEDYGISNAITEFFGKIQEKTSLLPDYAIKDNDSAVGTSLSGVVGVGIIVVLVLGVGAINKKVRAKHA